VRPVVRMLLQGSCLVVQPYRVAIFLPLVWDQEVAGSNPVAPTISLETVPVTVGEGRLWSPMAGNGIGKQQPATTKDGLASAAGNAAIRKSGPHNPYLVQWLIDGERKTKVSRALSPY
jgi:hypothetical protein